MKNNLINLIGGGGRMVIFLLTIPLLIKFMGVEKYGLWILLTSIGNVAMLLDSGLTGTSMFFVSKSIKSSKGINIALTSLLLINGIIFIIITLIFVLFSPLIKDLFFSNIAEPNITKAIMLIGLYSSILICHNIFIGVIQSFDDFFNVNIIKFSFLLILNFGLVIFSYYKFSFYQLTIWMVLTCFITLLFYVFLTVKKLKIFIWIYNKSIFKEVVYYSFNTWLGYAGNVLFNQFDKIILGLITTPYVLGAYAAIISITTYINSLATVGLQPLIPKVAKLFPQFYLNKNKIYRVFKFSLQFNTILVFCLGLFMMPFLDYILYDIMDIEKNNINLPLYFFIAIVIYSLNSLYVPGFYTLLAIKESKIVGRVQLFSAIFSLFFVFILGSSFGIMGAIIGNIGFMLSHYFNFYMSKKLKNNSFEWLKSIWIYLIVYVIIILIYFKNLDSLNTKVFLSCISILTLLILFIKKNINYIKKTLIK